MKMREIIDLIEMQQVTKYPLAPRSEWYGEANYEQSGGEMVRMTPDEFLRLSRPLEIDEISRENIDDLKAHIMAGKTLDPLALYDGGKEDGRHRAHAAKELGIKLVPVINFRKNEIDEASRYATPTPDHISALGKTPAGKYLYHGTPLDCLLNILKHNDLSTGMEWRKEGDRVALTRSYAVAERFSSYSSGGSDWGYEAILVLDWAKLAHDYEIHPYIDTDHAGEKWTMDEQEEAVYGAIRPLSKYLVSVNVDPAHLDAAMNDPEWVELCVDDKGFFKTKRGLVNAIQKIIASPFFNKMK